MMGGLSYWFHTGQNTNEKDDSMIKTSIVCGGEPVAPQSHNLVQTFSI